jgi:hypothetical protein
MFSIIISKRVLNLNIQIYCTHKFQSLTEIMSTLDFLWTGGCPRGAQAWQESSPSRRWDADAGILIMSSRNKVVKMIVTMGRQGVQ